MYAFLYIFMYSIFQKGRKSFSSNHIQNKKEALNKTSFRARDGTRTRDPDLGKVVLHQLSHSRKFIPSKPHIKHHLSTFNQSDLLVKPSTD